MVNGRAVRRGTTRPPPRQAGTIYAPNQRPGGRNQAFPIETRRLAVLAHQILEDHSPILVQARQGAFHPSTRTIRRWNHRHANLGHLQPFRRSGNRRSRVLKGYDLILLALYNIKFPTATALEKIAFLWNSWGRFQPDGGRLYDESQISRAEQQIGLSRKKTSVSSNRAFDLHVRISRFIFWTQPFPVGTVGVPRSAMIDLDECKLIMDYANRKYAKARIGRRCRVTGHYNGAGRLVIFAISGSEDGFRWMQMESEGGTNLLLFIQFIQMILDAIGHGVPGRRRCFMMDNLNVHHDEIVQQMIVGAGHYFIYRAPYWPKDGPIEYFFNSLEMHLRSAMYRIRTPADFEESIRNIIAQVQNFVPYFEHVGFRD